MKAAVHNEYGEPEVAKVVELPDPVPEKNECLVRVKACSMNPADWKYLAGHWKFVTGNKFPRQIGADFSGIVESVGIEVSTFKSGDQVIGSVNPFKTGAAAELVAVPESALWQKPDSLDFTEAAGIPIAGGTAYLALAMSKMDIRGKEVLITGAGGGVGHLAVQLAAHLGAEVTAVCSAEKGEFVEALGAAEVVDYNTVDIGAAGKQYDQILDCAAVYSYRTARPLLKKGGEFILLVLKGKLWLFAVAFLSGIFARRKLRTFLASPSGNRNRILSDLFESRVLKMTVSARLPLEETGQALRMLKGGHATGKIIIEIP
jgi:NADPH:quinone reductase-like Zn-dependent oxidoreductase